MLSGARSAPEATIHIVIGGQRVGRRLPAGPLNPRSAPPARGQAGEPVLHFRDNAISVPAARAVRQWRTASQAVRRAQRA
jgi:hypothetical protein